MAWLLLIGLFARRADGKEYENSYQDLFLFASTAPHLFQRVYIPNFSDKPYLEAKLNAYEGSKEWIKGIILSKAEEQNINPDLFLKIAKCESGLNPNAKNKNSSASGLFQFLKSTWNKTITELKQPNWDIFNPVHNAEAAAYLMSKDGTKHWLESFYCWKDF